MRGLWYFEQPATGGTQCLPTYTGAFVWLQGIPDVTPAYGAIFHVLTDVLATPVAMVTGDCKVITYDLSSDILLTVGGKLVRWQE